MHSTILEALRQARCSPPAYRVPDYASSANLTGQYLLCSVGGTYIVVYTSRNG